MTYYLQEFEKIDAKAGDWSSVSSAKVAWAAALEMAIRINFIISDRRRAGYCLSEDRMHSYNFIADFATVTCIYKMYQLNSQRMKGMLED